MKLPFPIKIPYPRKLILTQEFGNTANAQWYKDHGINLAAHNGVDVVVSGSDGERPDRATYGATLVCPVESAQVISREFDHPFSTKGNGITLVFYHEGRSFWIKFWHCSEVSEKKAFRLGETVGYIGNSGLVDPTPEYNRVFGGAHLHFMCKVDGQLVDPLLYFDINNPFRGDDSGPDKDTPALFFGIERIKKLFGIK